MTNSCAMRMPQAGAVDGAPVAPSYTGETILVDKAALKPYLGQVRN